MHRNEECLRDNRKTKRSFVPRQTPAYFSSASYFARVAADSAAFGGRYYPTTARHDRSAKQDNDNCAQFAVNDVPDNSQLSFTHGRQLSRLDRLAPGAEFNRRYDGQKCDGDKDGEFRHEGVTMKIVGGAFLKEKNTRNNPITRRNPADTPSTTSTIGNLRAIAIVRSWRMSTNSTASAETKVNAAT